MEKMNKVLPIYSEGKLALWVQSALQQAGWCLLAPHLQENEHLIPFLFILCGRGGKDLGEWKVVLINFVLMVSLRLFIVCLPEVRVVYFNIRH